MKYRIILVKNGKYKKTLHRCKTFMSSKENFDKLIEKNVQIKFPQKFLAQKNKIVPVEYKIYMVKNIEEGDKRRLVRDRMGRLYEEEPIFGIWTVLEDYHYNIEETFYVYGFNPNHDRKDVKFIMGLLLKNIKDQKLSKSIVVLHNKIIIYNESQFDIILCKCNDDAIRLYNVLLESSQRNNFKRLIFMGEAGDKLTGELYEMMMEETGWNYRKVTRISTTT